MSEQNSIYNIEGELVGRFRNGVAWSSPGMDRLGLYDQEFVYDNDKSIIAEINDGHVLNIIGEEIGHISGKVIFVGKSKVGTYIGLPEAGAAAIVFIFNRGGTRGS
nr:hypothetical protein [uncultured Desulfobulbus sp.]